MSWDHIDEKKFKALVKQISGTITKKDGELVPYHIIKGKGYMWCFQPSTKTVVKIPRGSKIYVLDFGNKKDLQCLAFSTDGLVFTIDKDEIEEIGFD